MFRAMKKYAGRTEAVEANGTCARENPKDRSLSRRQRRRSSMALPARLVRQEARYTVAFL